MTHRFFVAFSLAGLASLPLLAADGIPDTEQFDGIFEAASAPGTGKNLSLDAPISHSVTASISALVNYLAFLFRSPPVG